MTPRPRLYRFDLHNVACALNVRDSGGVDYYAAVRMIDACGLLNVNTAGYTRPVAAGQVIGVGDVAIGTLDAGIDVPVLTAARNTCPLDTGDMLALVWRGLPATDTGRLMEHLPTGAAALRGRLTVTSAGSTAVPRRPSMGPLHRGDVNALAAARDFQRLYEAFLAILVDSGNPNDVEVQAAQLAVNAIDFVDADSEITCAAVPISPPGQMVYGIERQPFITEVFHYEKYVEAAESIVQSSAIELYNPYAKAIDLDDYELTHAGGPAIPLSGTIQPRGRLVIRSHDWGDVGESMEVGDGFNTSYAVILWRHVGSTALAMDSTEGLYVSPPTDVTLENWRAKQRNDDPRRAAYSTVREHTYIGDRLDITRYITPGGNVAGRNNLGLPNYLDDEFGPVLAAMPTTPRPVYVRNGPFVSLWELACRIYRVGPKPGDALTDSLTFGGQETCLHAGPGPASVWPDARVAVPPGCLIADYFTLRAGDPLTPADGLININTAPMAVVRCLGGLSGLSPIERDKIAAEIIAYRDKLVSPAGTDYAGSTRGDPAVTGIANLRDAPAFACAGEVTIPVAIAAGVHNTYGQAPPQNYALGEGGSDDGLGSSADSPPSYPQDDYAKKLICSAWLSDQVSVRSDTFIAYIRIQKGLSATAAARFYVAVIDRSRCADPADIPSVRLFSEIR